MKGVTFIAGRLKVHVTVIGSHSCSACMTKGKARTNTNC